MCVSSFFLLSALDFSILLAKAWDLLEPAFIRLSQSPAFSWLLAPGLFICDVLGLDASGFGIYGMVVLALFSWWAWVRSLRVLYCVTGKAFGFYDPKHYLFFTRLWLPWRPPYMALMFVRRWFRQLGHSPANARWTGYLETACYPFNAKKDCILIGTLESHRVKLWMPIAIPGGERHVFICAGSGAGKTTQIMTNLGCLDPSATAFVVDCDGAMVNALGPALQAAGHRVVKLDPDNIAKGFPAGKWNPLDELTRADRRHGRAAVVAFAAILANALIVQDSQTQPVFADTARVFIKGLILFIWLFDDDKTLLRLRALLTGGLPEKVTKAGEDPFERLVFEMSNIGLLEDDGCNGEICAAIAAAAGVMNMGRNEKGNSFKSTAIYQTAFLDDPAIRATMDGDSDICGEDLKLATSAPVVFMVGTLTDIQTRLSPWVRAFSMLILYAFQRTAPEKKLKHPCLFILDEFPSLGRMEIVATAAPGFRKYGVRLITISQSLQRMQKTYEQEWRDFLGNAQCCLWLGLDDPETLKFLSEQMLGQTMKKEKVDGWRWYWRLLISMKLPRARYQMQPRWLLDVQQCKAFLDPTAGRIIVTRFGRAPIRCFRLSYWRELPVWKYAVGPYGESVLRGFTRAALQKKLACAKDVAPPPVIRMESDPALDVIMPEPLVSAIVVTASKTPTHKRRTSAEETKADLQSLRKRSELLHPGSEAINQWAMSLGIGFFVWMTVYGPSQYRGDTAILSCSLSVGLLLRILNQSFTLASGDQKEFPYHTASFMFYGGLLTLASALWAIAFINPNHPLSLLATATANLDGWHFDIWLGRLSGFAYAIALFTAALCALFVGPVLSCVLMPFALAWLGSADVFGIAFTWLFWVAVRSVLGAVKILPEDNDLRKIVTRWLVRLLAEDGRATVAETRAASAA